MANRWETVEAVADFIFLGSKITADGDCSHEIKRFLLLGRKVITNLDSILKSRDITLSRKVRLVKSRFFLWSCMDVRVGLWRKLSAEELMLFELWCWRRLLRVPWTARRFNQSILKINPEYSLEGRTDVEAETPKLWPLNGKISLIWKDPDAGKDWGQEEKGTTEDEMIGWASPTQWTWVWADSESCWWTGRSCVLRFMVSQGVGHDWATELKLKNWNWEQRKCYFTFFWASFGVWYIVMLYT